jgi:hypothetical protein
MSLAREETRSSVNYSDQFFLNLPEEARKYFVPSQKKLTLNEIINQRSACESAYISLNAVLRLYPLLRVRYVSANEIVRIVRHGIHELYKVCVHIMLLLRMRILILMICMFRDRCRGLGISPPKASWTWCSLLFKSETTSSLARSS